MGREHGDAFDAQRPSVHDVVVVSFHGDQLAVADGGDHAATTRTEIAGCGELANVFEFQLLCGCSGCRDVHELTDCEPYSAPALALNQSLRLIGCGLDAGSWLLVSNSSDFFFMSVAVEPCVALKTGDGQSYRPHELSQVYSCGTEIAEG